MIFYILFFLYSIFEVRNYIKYYKLKNKINKQIKNKNDLYLSKKNEISLLVHNTLNLLDYLTNLDETKTIKIIEQLFYDKIDISKITYFNLYNALCYYVYNKTNLNFPQSARIFSLINNIENKIGLKFIKKEIKQDYIKASKNYFNYWYHPFILIFIKKILKFTFHLFMLFIGFKYFISDNLIIYNNINNRDENDKKNIILFHCSVAGALSLIVVILKMRKKYNLIIPEIPGFSWNYYYDNDIKGLDYYNNILINYVKKENLNNLNLISHSLGGITLMKFYYKCVLTTNLKIDNIFFCESPVFPIYIFKLHSESYDLIKSIKNYLKNFQFMDILIIPFLQRDVYVQYYVNMDINMFDSCFFYKETDTKINIILVDNDNKIPSDFYIDYLKSKNLLDKINTKIFENNSHGAFLYNKNIQDFVLDELDR
jgi:hypothetical protein